MVLYIHVVRVHKQFIQDHWSFCGCLGMHNSPIASVSGVFDADVVLCSPRKAVARTAEVPNLTVYVAQDCTGERDAPNLFAQLVLGWAFSEYRGH